MAYFIGPSGHFTKDFTIDAANRHVCEVAFFVLNFLSAKTLKFYNGAALLATSANIPAGSTVQSIITTVDLTGVSTLTVKTSSRTLIVVGENFDYNVSPVKIQDINALLTSFLYSTDGGVTQIPIPQLIGANILPESTITFWET